VRESPRTRRKFVLSRSGRLRDLRQLRSFLGLAGYYRRFVKGYAKTAAPLNAMMKKGKTFHWTDDCQAAFEQLKEALSTLPILAMPDENAQYILDTDACVHFIEAVLSQVQDSCKKVIAYAGRTLSRNEMNYCVRRKELLVIVHYTRYFRQCLLGRQFTIRTDHAALTWLKKTTDPVGQDARCLNLLGEFDCVVRTAPAVSMKTLMLSPDDRV